jgi:tripartite motif-containing protein 71
MARRIAIWLTILAAATATLAGCGTTVGGLLGGARGGSGKHACPGARVCPYGQVEMIGRRGEGVLRSPEAIAIGPGGRVYVADQFSHTVQVFSASGHFQTEWGSFGSRGGQFGAVGGLAVDSHGDLYLVDSSNDRVEKFSAAGGFIASWGSPGSGLGQFDFGAGRGPDMPPGGGIAVNGPYVYVADTQNNRIERFALDGSGARVLVGPGSAPGEVVRPRGLAASANALYVTDDGNDRVQKLDLRGAFIAQTGPLPSTPETLADPFDVAVHGGFVYVADDNNGRIVKLTRDLQYVATFSGEGSYRLSKFVRAVAVDGAGRVYVADASRDRIDVFDSHGLPLRSWGTPGNAAGQFVAPLDVASGPGGQLLVVETFGPRSPMYRFSMRLAYLTTWRRGGEVILGHHWFSPSAAAFAPDGSVWVIDQSNELVRHLSATGGFLGVLTGEPDGASGRMPGAVTDGFAEPTGVAVNALGDVLVADTGHDRIEEFSASGRLLASSSGAGPGEMGFRAPLAVAVGPQGTVYVADTGNDRIVELSASGGVLTAWGGRGAGRGQFEKPSGIAIDASGHVFVSDMVSDRIQEFTSDGRLLRAWGTEGGGPGELSGPRGIAIDCQGDLLVADAENNRVQVFTHVASAAPCAGQPCVASCGVASPSSESLALAARASDPQRGSADGPLRLRAAAWADQK